MFYRAMRSHYSLDMWNILLPVQWTWQYLVPLLVQVPYHQVSVLSQLPVAVHIQPGHQLGSTIPDWPHCTIMHVHVCMKYSMDLWEVAWSSVLDIFKTRVNRSTNSPPGKDQPTGTCTCIWLHKFGQINISIHKCNVNYNIATCTSTLSSLSRIGNLAVTSI